MGINLGNTPIQDAKLGSTQVDKIYLGDELVWGGSPTPPVGPKALKFSSVGAQTLGIDQTNIGTLAPAFEYSNDAVTWTTWDITTTLSFGGGVDLYIRGTNNVLANSTNYTRFVFSTSEQVSCSGNIMHLFDHTQDLLAFSSLNSSYGVRSMFSGASQLVSAPDLPATTLPVHAYENLFYNCSQLTTPPKLPALTMTTACYAYMFASCSALSSIPALPATTLATSCYERMFNYCSLIKMSLTQDAEYPNEYVFGTAPSRTYARNMFLGTGGSFTSHPSRQIYYTANPIIS